MAELKKIILDDNEFTIDMGYRDDMRIHILLTDQNGIEHKETFLFRVYGEKPTMLEIRCESKLLYAASSQFMTENV